MRPGYSRHRLISHLNALFILSVLPALIGCDAGSKDVEGVRQQLEALVDKTSRKVESLSSSPEEVSEKASAELEKLFTFEYKVVDFRRDSNSTSIQRALNELGQDRWECFQLIPVDAGIAALCKRRPKTYLRYIPRMVP
jgi:hypothetical protein